MKRKIIQIAFEHRLLVDDFEEIEPQLYALDNYGKIWELKSMQRHQ